MPFDGLPSSRPCQPDDDTLAVLTLGRQIVHEGWSRGALVRHDYQDMMLTFCAVGAVRYAYNMHFGRNETYYKVDQQEHPADVLALATLLPALPLLARFRKPATVQTIYAYNDTRRRSRAEVLNVFDRAIARRRRAIATSSRDRVRA